MPIVQQHEPKELVEKALSVLGKTFDLFAPLSCEIQISRFDCVSLEQEVVLAYLCDFNGHYRNSLKIMIRPDDLIFERMIFLSDKNLSLTDACAWLPGKE